MAQLHSVSRKPLHERSDSDTNKIAVRLVPRTPPQYLGQRAGGDDEKRPYHDIYSRSALPTLAAHVLSPVVVGDRIKHLLLQGQTDVDDVSRLACNTKARGSPAHETPRRELPPDTSPLSSPRPRSKKRKHVAVHSDKTFSVLDLVQQDPGSCRQDARDPAIPGLGEAGPGTSVSDATPAAAAAAADADAHDIEAHPHSSTSCNADLPAPAPAPVPALPSTSSARETSPIVADPIDDSPSSYSYEYQLVGGLRKVPPTPDRKTTPRSTDSIPVSPTPVPPLPITSDESETRRTLHAKRSSLSTTSTDASVYTNYKLYRPSTVYANFRPFSAGDSSVARSEQPLSSPPAARPSTASASSNYELHGDPSPSASFATLPSVNLPQEYSQESLLVAPLRPRTKRSNETLGYFKSRSRESLRSRSRTRTNSINSINTVLTHGEAYQATVATPSLIYLPSPTASGSWTNSSILNRPRFQMNVTPHQWSSQLSTVMSEGSEGATDRGSQAWSQSWSESNGRRSSGFPSLHSRRMLSISSSLAQDEMLSRSGSLEPPQSTYSPQGRRDLSNSPVRMVADIDEHGDSLGDLHQLQNRPSRQQLSGFYSSSSSDVGRSNTQRSTTSSRANSIISASIPTWAK